jgi:hypothetical protein
MARIFQFKALPDYHLLVEIDDGVVGAIDLSERLFGPVFDPWGS